MGDKGKKLRYPLDVESSLVG